MPTVIYKDILDVTKGIICHQINPHTMGAGLALAIRKRYPKHYEDFLEWKKDRGMGDILVTTYYQHPIIIGMCAQRSWGRDGRNHTNYPAFAECLRLVDYEALKRSMKVYFPYKIGCGLAGGKWEFVYQLIEAQTSYAYICKLGKEPK